MRQPISPERTPFPAVSDARQDALLKARQLLDEGEPSLSVLAAAVGLSPSHLQRRFRARFGLSPAEYLAQRKLGTLKAALREGSDVSAALYDAGYGSPSRVYEHGAARLGMTPARYRAGGAGEDIRYSCIETALGRALIAATARGICAVELGEDDAALAAGLRREFPQAQLSAVDAGRDDWLAPRVRAIADALAGRADSGERGMPGKPGQPATPVAVDLIGTAFQARVWEALMRIPSGHTRSYAELATELGSGARAVASACARNRVAVLVPCHRIVRGDGSLGGYRWGLPRKRTLLEREAAQR